MTAPALVILALIVLLLALNWRNRQRQRAFAAQKTRDDDRARNKAAPQSRRGDRSVEPLDLSTIEWPQPLTAIELRRLAKAQRPDGPVLGIVYRSAAGEQTARIIMPTVLDNELFQAWCYRREDMRTFRHDRCVLFYDPRTGEILNDFEAALRTGESIRADLMAIRSKRDKKPRRLK